MTRKWLQFGVSVLAGSALTVGVAFSGSAQRPSPEALARSTAREFFQTINTRHFERTCELMSVSFYRENHVPDRARCVLALRIGFTWAQSYRFRILRVRVHRHRAIVEVVVNGARGRIVLLEENSRFRVLSVGGS
jgi:anti-sigma-K factor RskA